MWEVCESSVRVARKEYDCDAWPWIDNSGLVDEDYTEEQFLVLAEAKKQGCKILKGDKYLHVKGKFEGDWCTYRARLDLNDLCNELDLFDY